MSDRRGLLAVSVPSGGPVRNRESTGQVGTVGRCVSEALVCAQTASRESPPLSPLEIAVFAMQLVETQREIVKEFIHLVLSYVSQECISPCLCIAAARFYFSSHKPNIRGSIAFGNFPKTPSLTLIPKE